MKIQERFSRMRSRNDYGRALSDFPGGLHREGRGLRGPRQSSCLCAPGSYRWLFYTMDQWCLCFSGWAPQGRFLPFHKKIEREKGIWSSGCSRAGGFINGYHSVLPITLSQGYFYWINTWGRGLVKKEKLESNFGNNRSAEQSSWLVLGFGFGEARGTTKSIWVQM